MGDLFGWGTVQYYYDLLGNLWKIFIIDETCRLCMVMRWMEDVLACHLWLTGCEGEMGSQLKRLLGFDKWIIGKELTIYWSITRAKGKSSISHSRCRNCSGGTWSEENIYCWWISGP